MHDRPLVHRDDGFRHRWVNSLTPIRRIASTVDLYNRVQSSCRTFKRIEAGESVREITADSKTASLSQSGFYKMMQAGDEALVQR